jgi:type III pantothenate kinase
MTHSALLAFNVGNTHIKVGLFDRLAWQHDWRLETNVVRTEDEYGLQIFQLLRMAQPILQLPIDCVIASVVPSITPTLARACAKHLGCEPMIVDHTFKSNLKIRYDDPSQLGMDRWIGAVAAFERFGGPTCVIDFGTATTFNAISSSGEFLGGAIAPGVRMFSEPLSQRTARLPKVVMTRPPSVIGRNTIHGIQSGLMFGYLGLVEGMIARMKTELGANTQFVATGGWAESVIVETNLIHHHVPNLTLDGLKLVWDINIVER